jgi:hypothetical protein
MRLMKYNEGWTRRHFLDQVGRGVFAAGVLSPLIDVIGRHGSVEAAYPPELLSIEAYTKGKLKPGRPAVAGAALSIGVRAWNWCRKPTWLN